MTKAVLRCVLAVVSAAWFDYAFAAATMLDDGFTEEEWVRTGTSPCTGGSSIRRLTTSGDYVHIYNDTNGVFRVPADKAVKIHYLLVGGGGGGGATSGGGGGGGGVVFGTMTLDAGETIAVFPGQGGLGHGMNTTFYDPWAVYKDSVAGSNVSSGHAASGNATRLVRGEETISAPGGGGGGTFADAGVAVSGAGRGGNGGTHGRATGGGSQWESGGAASADPNHAGNGADGCGTYIAGEIRYFGGGGGGSCGRSCGTCAGGTGGIGGGGNGRSSTEGWIGDCGEPNSGGGGGGGNHATYHIGGLGGRGVVIIRYAAAGLTPVVNSCIDRTFTNGEDIVIGEYTATDGTVGELSEGAPGLGGDEVRQLSNGEYVHKFTQSGTFTAPVGADTVVQYLVIGGGGAGGASSSGSYYAGGGGGGGVRFGTMTLKSGITATITVGSGGAAGSHGGSGGNTDISAGDLVITAHGGGGGGWYSSSDGYKGGSGGGSNGFVYDLDEGRWAGPGSGETAGGGGGAGRPGKKATVKSGKNCGGDGGDGVYCAITGVLTPYAGGGGAGTRYWGGKGGAGGSDGACYSALANNNPAPTPPANSGGGGGGGNGYTYNNCFGSRGAAGVVILRYASNVKPVEGGSTYDISAGIDEANPLDNCRGETLTTRALGGAWTRLSNGDFLHRFDVGNWKFLSPGTNNGEVVSSLRYLIVAGGGSGGACWSSGGGGGGGVLAGYRPGASAEKFLISVGAGAAAVPGGAGRGLTGSDSSLTHASGMLFLAKGGGSGGQWYDTPGGSGGSGGGAAGSTGVNAIGGSGLTSACHKGGNVGSSYRYFGAGGGGACEDGDGDFTDGKCGDGGDGYNSTITGVAEVYYGGGGGGGHYEANKASIAGANGLGGGHENYGGGGKAHTAGQDTGASEAGGPGVVYIRYASAVPTEGEGAIPLGASGVDVTHVEDFAVPTIRTQRYKRETHTVVGHTFSPGLEPVVGPFEDIFGDTLMQGVDYTVTYSNNTARGTGYVVIKGNTPAVVGEKIVPFEIRSGDPTIFYIK